MEKITKTNKDGIIKVVIEEIPEKQIRERINRTYEEANEAVFGYREDQEIEKIKRRGIVDGRIEDDSIILTTKEKNDLIFNITPQDRIFIEKLKKEFKIK